MVKGKKKTVRVKARRESKPKGRRSWLTDNGAVRVERIGTPGDSHPYLRLELAETQQYLGCLDGRALRSLARDLHALGLVKVARRAR